MRRFETSHGTLRKWSDSGLRPSGGHPRVTSKLQTTFFTTPLKLQAFFEAWSFSPWPRRSGPKTSRRGFKTRSQPSLDAKERFSKNACFPKEIQGFLRVGWPSCAVDIPFFRSEAATASHLDSKIQRNPWVTPLPHFTKNSKNPFSLFSLLSSLFSLLSSLCP